MSNDGSSLPERIANYYEELFSVAADLNAVSDELGKFITQIDTALKRLNLGITTWVTIQGGEDAAGITFWSRDIGYARVGGKWGICLRKMDGDNIDPDNTRVEEWAFNDAPRALRLQAIGKIPDLLAKLSEEALKTTNELRARLADAQTVAEAIMQAASRPRSSQISDSSPKPQQRTFEDAPHTALSPGKIRHDVVAALADAGHASAAGLLANASWTLDRSSIRIQVLGVGKKMLAITVNAAAEKIIREQLKKLGAPTQIQVLREDRLQTGSEVK